MNYYQFWGKTVRSRLAYHLLPYHALDVAAVGQVLLERDPYYRKIVTHPTLCGDLTPLLTSLLCFHDMGKFDPGFQAQRKDVVACLKGLVPPQGIPSQYHSDSGYWFLREHISTLGFPGVSVESGTPPDIWDVLHPWKFCA
jgi:CRISPR-associated endonuclease/helicase Cas3